VKLCSPLSFFNIVVSQAVHQPHAISRLRIQLWRDSVWVSTWVLKHSTRNDSRIASRFLSFWLMSARRLPMGLKSYEQVKVLLKYKHPKTQSKQPKK